LKRRKADAGRRPNWIVIGCSLGMRVTVGTIVGLLAAGRSADDALVAYPYLEKGVEAVHWSPVGDPIGERSGA
jgi:uncharacterized protein DUF433